MSMKTSRFKAWARHIFSALVIAGLVAYLWAHRGDIEAGMSISAGQLGLLVVLILLTWVLNSLPMLVFVRLMHKRVGFWENLAVSVAGGLANYLPMRIGTVIRMRFFKKAHHLDYSAFIGIMGVRTLLLLALTGMLGCAGAAGLSLAGEAVPIFVNFAFAGMATLPLLAMFIPLQVSNNSDKFWWRLFRKLAAGHSVLRANPAAFWLLVLIILAQFAVLGVRLFIAFQVFGLDVSLWALLLLGPVATLVTFVSITPGNLGVREWIIAGLTGITGLNFQSGVFAGTLDRSVSMALTFIVGPICLYYTLRKTHEDDARVVAYKENGGIPTEQSNQ